MKTIKYVILFNLLVSVNSITFATEQLDSLIAELNLLEEKNDAESLSKKANLSSEIADMYMRLYSNQDYSRTYLLQGISFLRKKISHYKATSNDLVLISDFYRRLGLFEMFMGNVQASEQYLAQCKNYLDQIQGKVAQNIRNKALYDYYASYYAIGINTRDFEKAEKNMKKAYLIVEKDSSLHVDKINALSQLSVLYSMTGDHTSAIGFSKQALSAYEADPIVDQPLDRFIFFHLRALSFAGQYDQMHELMNSYSHYSDVESLKKYLDANKGMVTRTMFECIFLMGKINRDQFLATNDSTDLLASYKWLTKGFTVAEYVTLITEGEKIGSVLLRPNDKMNSIFSTFALMNDIGAVLPENSIELIKTIDFYQSSRLHLERVAYKVNQQNWLREKELKNQVQYVNIKIDELGADSTLQLTRDSLIRVQNQLAQELVVIKNKTKREKVLDNYRFNQADYANKLLSYLDTTDKNLLTYFYNVKDSVVYIIGANAKDAFFKKVNVPQSFKTLISESYSYNSNIQLNAEDRRNQDKKNHLLYTYLFKPIQSKISSSKVLVYPLNEMSYISFDAMLDSTNNYLVQNYQFQYTSSLFSVISTAAKIPNDNSQFLSFYPSNYGTDSLAFLLNAKQEVAEIEKQLDAKTFVNGQANKQNFLEKANDNKVIHIASHSHLNVEKPYESYIIFDHSADSLNNHLHAYEIFSLTINADLITLSSCNSAKGGLEDGIGVVSLSNAFYFAGIPSTISSLWSAQDKSSSEIMIAFYKYLGAGESKSASLQKAKIDYLNSADKIKEQPFFWANYVLYGADDPIYSPSTSSTKKWVLITSVALLAGIIFILIYLRSSKRAAASAA